MITTSANPMIAPPSGLSKPQDRGYWLRLYVAQLLSNVDPQTVTSQEEVSSVAKHCKCIAEAALAEIGDGAE